MVMRSQAGSSTAYVEGLAIPVPASLVNSTLPVPPQLLAAALGLPVSWDDAVLTDGQSLVHLAGSRGPYIQA